MITIVRSVISEHKVEYLQVMNEKGEVDEAEMPQIDPEKIKEMYGLMNLMRAFDEKLFKLQRSGKIGTYAEVRGQEACQIASSLALEKNDWMVPSFREMAAFLARGADRATLVQGWKGDTRAFETAEMRCLPPSIPIASQCVHAVGLAWASKLKKEKDVTLVYFGDGATSEGDFHEAMNFASVYDTPVIFFNQNNGWAISTPRAIQTKARSIAQKAIAYDMPSIQIDGNDVFAVYKATMEAIERARKGEGPTLIEAITFRMGDHTTSDSSEKYRDPKLCEEWAAKDPILRLRTYLYAKGIWDDAHEERMKKEIEQEVSAAVEKGLSVEPPTVADLFAPIYTQLPEEYKRQQQELETEQRGDQ